MLKIVSCDEYKTLICFDYILYIKIYFKLLSSVVLYNNIFKTANNLFNPVFYLYGTHVLFSKLYNPA